MLLTMRSDCSPTTRRASPAYSEADEANELTVSLAWSANPDAELSHGIANRRAGRMGILAIRLRIGVAHGTGEADETLLRSKSTAPAASNSRPSGFCFTVLRSHSLLPAPAGLIGNS